MNVIGSDTLATLWVLALVVIPALPAAYVLARHASGNWPTAILIAAAIGLAGSGVTSMASQVLGIGLRNSLIGYVLLVVMIDVALVVWGRGSRRKRLRLDLPGLGLMLFIGIVALVEQPWLAPNVDAFYHIAAARSLFFFDSAVVTDPFYGIGGALADPTSGALHVALAFVSYVSRIDPAGIWAGVNVVSATLLPAAFLALYRQMRAPAGYALGSAFAAAFLGSVGDFRFAGYPGRVGVVFVILAVAGLIAVVQRRKGGLLVVAIASFAAATIHTGIAVSLLAVLGVVFAGMLIYAYVEERRGVSTRSLVRRLFVGELTAVGAATIAAVPRLWFIAQSNYGGAPVTDAAAGPSVSGLLTVFGHGVFFYPQSAMRGGDVMVLVGVALAVVCLVGAVRRRDAAFAMAGVFALVPIAIGVNPVVTPLLVAVSPYVTWRTLDLLWYGPYVALPLGAKLRPYIGLMAMAGALLSSLPAMHMLFTDAPPVAVRPGVLNVSLWEGWSRDVRYDRGGGSLPELGRVFGDEWPLIATDDMTGYNIAGLLPVRTVAVAGVHAPAFLEHDEIGAKRRRAVNELIKTRTTHRRRAKIIDETDPDYVLMWPGRVAPEARSAIIADTELFEVVYNRDGVVLLRVLAQPPA